jgi:Zn-dependent alcohol dehydrogenase
MAKIETCKMANGKMVITVNKSDTGLAKYKGFKAVGAKEEEAVDKPKKEAKKATEKPASKA